MISLELPIPNVPKLLEISSAAVSPEIFESWLFSLIGIMTFQANPNLELLGSYDSNGDWKSQVQLFFRY